MSEKNNKHDNKGGENKINLKFIVNTTPKDIIANINTKLEAAATKALEQTGNGGDISNWHIKLNGEGDNLDMSKKIKDFGFKDGVELFLSPNAGVGGNNN